MGVYWPGHLRFDNKPYQPNFCLTLVNNAKRIITESKCVKYGDLSVLSFLLTDIHCVILLHGFKGVVASHNILATVQNRWYRGCVRLVHARTINYLSFSIFLFFLCCFASPPPRPTLPPPPLPPPPPPKKKKKKKKESHTHTHKLENTLSNCKIVLHSVNWRNKTFAAYVLFLSSEKKKKNRSDCWVWSGPSFYLDGIQQFPKRAMKALIRHCERAGWSQPLMS